MFGKRPNLFAFVFMFSTIFSAAIISGEESPLAKVKMQTDFGLPFIELTFKNGKTGLFILDTGFDENIVDAGFAKELRLTVENPKNTLQPGGSIEMGKIRGFSFQIGDLVVESISAQTAPLSQLSGFIGVEFHGILGHTFIERYVLRLNYSRSEMLIFASDVAIETGNFRVVPIHVMAGEVLIPFTIKQNIGRHYYAQLKLDTGSVSGLGFALNFYEDADLQNTAPNYLSTIGLGGGGTTENRAFKIDLLNVAGSEFRNSVAGVTIEAAGTERRDNAGTLGAEILARQDLILDYSHGRIMLGEEYETSVGIPADRSGMWIIESDGKKTVFQVYKNTPAANAGLQQGSIITKLNNLPASEYSLDRVARLLGQESETPVQLSFINEGKPKQIQLVLRDLFTN